MDVYLGTSAANPFIIPGDTLSFTIVTECLLDGEGDDLREKFLDVVDQFLDIGGGDNPNTSYNPATTANDTFRILAEESSSYSDISWDVSSITHASRHTEGSDESKLISMVSNTPTYSGGDGPSGMKCRGGVVAKKGSATFGLRRTIGNLPGHNNSQSVGKRDYKIFLDSIPAEGLELWTFVRKWLPGSPWYALEPSRLLATGSTLNNNLNTFYSGSGFTQRSLDRVSYSPGTQNQQYNSFGPINAGHYPRYAEDHETEGLRNLLFYKQYNNARDFVVPFGKLNMRSIVTDFPYATTAFSTTQPAGIDSIDYMIAGPGSSDNYKINEYTNSFMGVVVPDQFDLIDSQYFICSPRPKSFMESGQTLNDDRAKLFSLADGVGGQVVRGLRATFQGAIF